MEPVPAVAAPEAGHGGLATLGLADEPAYGPADDPVDEDLRDLVAEAEEYETPDEPEDDGIYDVDYADDDFAVPAADLEETAFEQAAFDGPPLDAEPFDRAPFDGPSAFEPAPLEPAPFEPAPLEAAPFEPAAFDAALLPEADEDVFAVPLPDPVSFEPVGTLPPPRADQHLGHRIEGWVRPEYRHVPEEPPAGEYWTPIPVGLEPDPEPSAKGYGWPRPVERLPAVPDYEPATGFDLAPVEHEPTELVATWSADVDERPGRIRLPRNWSARNDKRRAEDPPVREWRDDAAPVNTQLFAAVTEEPRPAPSTRRRPRPRPRPTVTPPDRSTTVYVSRHAAEPPR